MTVQNESATESATDAKTHGAILTEAAAVKAKSLLEQEGRDDLALRIAVQPGGCAGLHGDSARHRRRADPGLPGGGYHRCAGPRRTRLGAAGGLSRAQSQSQPAVGAVEEDRAQRVQQARLARQVTTVK